MHLKILFCNIQPDLAYLSHDPPPCWLKCISMITFWHIDAAESIGSLGAGLSHQPGLDSSYACCTGAHKRVKYSAVNRGRNFQQTRDKSLGFFRRMPVGLMDTPLFGPYVRHAPILYATSIDGIKANKFVARAQTSCPWPYPLFIPYQQGF